MNPVCILKEVPGSVQHVTATVTDKQTVIEPWNNGRCSRPQRRLEAVS